MKFCISLFLISSFFSSIAQNFDRVDRLNDSLKLDLNKETRVEVLCEISDELKNFDFEIAKSYTSKALQLIDTSANNKVVALYYKSIADIDNLQGNHDSALKNYSRAAAIYDELGMEKELGSIYNNLAVAYRSNMDLDNAFSYAFKGVESDLKNNQPVGASYVNLSSTYGMKASLTQDLSLLDSAKYFAELAMEKTSKDDPRYAKIISNAGLNLSNIHAMTGNLDSAFYWMDYTIEQFTGDSNYVDLKLAYASRAYLYLQLKEYDKALEDANKAISLTDSGDIDLTATNIIHQSYWEMGACDSAYNYAANLIAALNQKHVDDLSKNSSKYMSVFQNEKKLQQIKSLEKDKKMEAIESAKKDEEIKNQRLTIAGIALGLILLLALALVLIRRNNEKKKSNQALQAKNELIENQKDALEERNTEIMDSIHYAKYIQESLLPAKKVVKSYLPESFILFKPKELVSGDFYWMHTEGDDLYIAVADCTGHGVPGAMVSVVGTNGLKRCLNELKLKQPSKILDHLAEYVIETFNSEGEREVKDGMDIGLIKINFKTNKLEFAGANNPLWILKNQEIQQVNADRQPVGKHTHPSPFTNHEIQLEKGDRLFMFSDGYADQFGGPKGKKLKSKTFKNILIENSHTNMETLHDILKKTIEDWMGGLEQIDDISVIGIEV